MKTINVNRKKSGYTLWNYQFFYDWRLSPMSLADELKMYIDRVKAATGKDKVSIVSRCLGSNIVQAYCAKYEQHAAESLDTSVMIVPSTLGLTTLTGIFSGNIVLDEDCVERFADFCLDNQYLIEDPETANFVSIFISLLNEVKVLGLGVDAIQRIIDNVKDNIVPRLVRASLGTCPSYWAMICPESYIETRDFVFNGVEEEYAGLIEKIDDYYYNVALTIEDTIMSLKDKGVTFEIVSKYGTQNLPVYPGADEQGDIKTGTAASSFGCTAAPLTTVLSDDYIKSLGDNVKYLSPDHKIDASTCLFPDNTWFIKDLLHSDFNAAALDPLLYELIHSHGTMTVFDNENYPQYLSYDKENHSLIPIIGLDDEGPVKGSDEKRFSVFIRFFTSLFNFIVRLLKGEIDLDNIITL